MSEDLKKELKVLNEDIKSTRTFTKVSICVLLIIVVVGFFLMWGYILYLEELLFITTDLLLELSNILGENYV